MGLTPYKVVDIIPEGSEGDISDAKLDSDLFSHSTKLGVLIFVKCVCTLATYVDN